LPAIFVQVPSGLAASGSLLAGISSADQITNTTLYANGTSKVNGTSTVSNSGGGDGWGHPFFGYSNWINTTHTYILPYVVCFFPIGTLLSSIYRDIPYLCHLYILFTRVFGGLDQDLGRYLLTRS
jgi:hypothetical protein